MENQIVFEVHREIRGLGVMDEGISGGEGKKLGVVEGNGSELDFAAKQLQCVLQRPITGHANDDLNVQGFHRMGIRELI